ncbi:MAG: iron-sulfur cluster assembly scaffold protein [Deltaproteobacteria bacterium]|nr:iron-sulfur cluster assembly scaffold protein [Deltaproteobacteria bacterium]MBW1912617.1 iron-sulfur cluster assembly scaffold protein [Deltaproteobacteria bacterium]
MDKSLDDFAQRLQEQIFEETKEAYGEVVYRRWRNPLYLGSMSDPDGFARVKGTCGDTMEVYLKFGDSRVKEAAYRTDGCGSSNVCGSFAAEMSIGKSPDEILEITGEKILNKLGEFPEEEEHCAFLAAETLHEALNDYMVKETIKRKQK